MALCCHFSHWYCYHTLIENYQYCFFFSVAIIINVIIIFLTWILSLSLKLTYIIVIIIIVIIIIIINYYLSLLLLLFFFRTYPNALYCFLVKSRVVRLATTIDVQAKLLITVNLSAHIVSYQVATTIAVRTCFSRSLLTLCITVILLYAFYIVSCTLSNKHFRVRVRVRVIVR